MSNQDGGRETGPTVIPAEAVEAAAHALFEKELGRPMEVSDEPLYSEDIQACREDARAALEAAAPYMLAALADSRDGELFRFTWAQREWLRGGAK